MIPKNIMSKNTRKLPNANPFLMSLTDFAAHTLCQEPWLNISAVLRFTQYDQSEGVHYQTALFFV